MAARFQNNGRRGRAATNGALSPSVGEGSRTHGHGIGKSVSASSHGADEGVVGGRGAEEQVEVGETSDIGVIHGGTQQAGKPREKLVAHPRADAKRGRTNERDAAGTQAYGDEGHSPAPIKTPRLGFARPIRLAVIGAGKVGCSLSRYLANGPSVEVVGFYSRNPLASEEATGFAGGRIFATAADAVRAAEVILVTTPDGAIADVWEQLRAEAGHAGTEGGRTDAQANAGRADTAENEASTASSEDVADASEGVPAIDEKASKPASEGKSFSWDAAPDREPLGLGGKIFVHCSGALASDVFEGAKELGASAVAMHPLYAVSSRFGCWQELEQAWFSLEGDPEGTHVLEALLRARGNHVLHVAPKDKTRYHAAAVMASNLVVGLYNMAASELAQCGISPEDAQAALAPLFLGNAAHIAEDGVAASLTGPAVRGDWATLNAHLGILEGDERRLAAYRSLTDELIAIAHPDDAPGGLTTPAWDIDEA